MSSRRLFLRTSFFAACGWWTAANLLAAAGPGGTVHVVKRGDTLSAIARRYGVTVASLRAHNHLSNDLIRVGQTLVVHPAVATSPALKNVIATTNRLRIPSGRWRYIVTHHSGIESGNARAYDREHRRRGMEHGLAYHFVIGNGRDSREGEIEIGRRWLQQLRGGHVRSEAINETGIGICLVGNFERRVPSRRQLQTFTDLVDWLRRDLLAAAPPRVTVHRWVDRNHTVCPGRQFPFSLLQQRYGAHS